MESWEPRVCSEAKCKSTGAGLSEKETKGSHQRARRGMRMGGAILSQSTEAWPTGEEAALPDEPSEQSCRVGIGTPHPPLTQLASTRLLSWCPSVFGINTLKRRDKRKGQKVLAKPSVQKAPLITGPITYK